MLGAFVVYNANLSYGGCGDDLPYRLLPLALVRDQTVSLAAYLHLIPLYPDGSLHYTVVEHAGRLVTIYPPAPGVFAVPVFGAASFLWVAPPLLLLGKLTASAVAALSVGVMFAALRRTRLPVRTSVLLAVVYALATPVFAVASQALCQHPFSTLAVAGVVYAAVRVREGTPSGWPAAGGVIAGLAVAVRPQTAIALAPVVLYLLWRGSGERGPLLAGGAAPLIATMAHNIAFTGRLGGGYAFAAETLEGVDLGGNLFVGASGLLASPSRGLFVYVPVALFGVAGAVRAWRRRDPLLVAAALGIVGTVLLFGKFTTWWAGGTYGPRYLVETMPLVVLLLTPLFRPPSMFGARRPWAALFLASAALSLVMQVIGVFSFPCSWNRAPERPLLAQERLWDWRDPPFVRCAGELHLFREGLTRPFPLDPAEGEDPSG